MKNFTLTVLISITSFFLVFCSENHRYDLDKYNRNSIETRHDNVKKLLGRRVIIIDTLDQINPFALSDSTKAFTLISMYIASCSPCLVKMKKWEDLIETNSVFRNVSFVFYAQNRLTWYFNHQVNESESVSFQNLS